ncbi:Hypothetical predicted protein [Octopus vulgaris]|uniref:Uncharacterized protein n=1 Tax=Octopus vulgaris TaxID=6645 RepID=A0AA36B309_OCTVU|nr:Hypothetical predicted protein [Octopus vulgaris]
MYQYYIKDDYFLQNLSLWRSELKITIIFIIMYIMTSVSEDFICSSQAILASTPCGTQFTFFYTADTLKKSMFATQSHPPPPPSQQVTGFVPIIESIIGSGLAKLRDRQQNVLEYFLQLLVFQVEVTQKSISPI